MIYNIDREPLKLSDSLYFSSIVFNGYQNNFWQGLYEETGPGGKFAINLARRLSPNRFVSRNNSEWSLPWPQKMIPKYQMVSQDHNFKLTFSEVSDLKALDFKNRINNHGEKFAIMYSGGLDSTTIVVALLKNLNEQELKNIAICTSVTAIIENPDFWKKYLLGKFEIIDSMSKKYHDVINMGYTPVTADDGDCIFGTVFGLGLYYGWEKYAADLSDESRAHISNIIDRFSDPEVHWSEFKDILIKYFSIPANQMFPQVALSNPDPDFGRLLYEKFKRNVETSSVPIQSLHDFFWWLIFNVKMLNCGIRGALYYNDFIDPNTAIHRIENWYLDQGYQQWSMNNNNNGQKIVGGAASYKQAAREYIYEFDKNEWYRSFKLKLESMALTVIRQDLTLVPNEYIPNARFGIDDKFQLLSIDSPDVKEYIRYHINNYKIDWS